MEIRINREVRDYHETIFFGLSARQFGCALGAVAVAVGAYFLFREVVGKETASWLCMLCAAPLAAAGFFRYNGMTLERFLWAVIKTKSCAPDGEYTAVKTCMTSFYIRRKRKKGKNANEDFSVWEKTDADFGASAKDSAADHSHPQDLPRRYLGGRGKI